MAAIMLVILRVAVGWHFLYEGVWKMANPFSAEPFLAQAKGPFAPLFYAMVPDIDGRQRLELVPTGKLDSQGNQIVTSPPYASAWSELLQEVIDRYKLNQQQVARAKQVLALYQESLQSYLTEHRTEIEAYLASFQRFHQRKAAGTNRAAYEKKRIWDQQQKLRAEADTWLSELDTMAEHYQLALWDLLDEEQKARGPIHAPRSQVEALPFPLPLIRTRMEALNLAITYGLAAIGACLIAGFCTRLACLGGAAFLAFVLLSQPPLPAVYPPAPEAVGHALIVDKNFVEMVALLLLAATAVG